MLGCSSCALFLKQDYPRLLGSKEANKVSNNLYYITEYFLKLHSIGQLNTDFRDISQTIFYHTPCHLRTKEFDNPTVRLLNLIPGIMITKISQECCGMGGAYGNEKVNYELSNEIASRIYSQIEKNQGK